MPSNIPVRLQESLASRYVLERELARGGMATVYLGRDMKHDRAVAVKVLRPELGALLGSERFLREIKLVARLQHPHILPLYDSGEAGGSLYYVMPYVAGDSLRDRLRREKLLPVRDALWITREVADALYYAHANEIVHRDVKPENILLSGAHAMVADFGIARAVHAAGGERWETLTDSGVAVGTPAYMSPEQTAGDHEVDGRSDIYSLGCVVYEMLIGSPPFMGPDGEVMIARRFTDPPPVLRAVREDVPESVDEAVQRALAPEPAERFANALEFTEAIWQESRTTPGVPGVHRVRHGEQRRAGAARQQAAARHRSVTRHRARWIAGGAVTLGAAALAAFWLAQSPGARPTRSLAPVVAAPESAPPITQPQQQAARVPATIPPAAQREPAPEPKIPARSVRAPPATRTRALASTEPRADSMLPALRVAALRARSSAVNDGASPADLLAGDSLLRIAEASAAAGRAADAIVQLSNASALWADGALAARSRTAQATARKEPTVVPLPAPPVAARPSTESAPARPPAADPSPAIRAVIANYGRAIEARNLPAIRQLYPTITAAQQRDWQQFFSAVNNVKVRLAITQLDVSGSTADARITGTYQYENTSARGTEQQAVRFRVSLRRDSAGWQMTGIQ